jgi:putative toxin-antitoxin system antitoxin component (TIGR02293 family)
MSLSNIFENNLSVLHYLNVTVRLGVPPIASEEQLAALIQERLPITSLNALEANGILSSEIETLVIPRRTLSHRKAKQERLSVDESDRAVRVARITSLAEEIFGDRVKALRWLRKPKIRFDGRSPMSLLETETGARTIEEWLNAIDYGMLA